MTCLEARRRNSPNCRDFLSDLPPRSVQTQNSSLPGGKPIRLPLADVRQSWSLSLVGLGARFQAWSMTGNGGAASCSFVRLDGPRGRPAATPDFYRSQSRSPVRAEGGWPPRERPAPTGSTAYMHLSERRSEYRGFRPSSTWCRIG